jgi:hypothetical protein
MTRNESEGKTNLTTIQSMFFSCILLFMSSIILFICLYYVNQNFSSNIYYIYGYSAGIISNSDILVLILVTFLVALSMPKRIDAPSSLFIIFIYYFILVPLQVMSLSSNTTYESQYYVLLFLTHFCLLFCCLTIKNKSVLETEREPVVFFSYIIFAGWLLSAVLLYYTFRDIMSFSSFDAIYIQRAAGRATNFYTGYLQTYNQYVFSTGLVAIGLALKKRWLVIVGFSGAMLNYSITAEKAGLIYPLFVVVLYFMISNRRKFLSTSSFVGLGLAAILFIALIFQNDDGRTDFALWYLGTRSLLTPGTFILQYQDFFSSEGYTFFSHIRGLNMFIDVPPAYASDPRWPAIGLIVGEDHLGIPTLNANANFIASDGIAGLGLPGIVIAFAVLTLYLRLLDRVTAGIDKKLVLPILLPLALTLTNGSVFTILTSFGGIFWLIAFVVFFRRQNESRIGVLATGEANA